MPQWTDGVGLPSLNEIHAEDGLGSFVGVQRATIEGMDKGGDGR